MYNVIITLRNGHKVTYYQTKWFFVAVKKVNKLKERINTKPNIRVHNTEVDDIEETYYRNLMFKHIDIVFKY
jgi:hypothetical protein